MSHCVLSIFGGGLLGWVAAGLSPYAGLSANAGLSPSGGLVAVSPDVGRSGNFLRVRVVDDGPLLVVDELLDRSFPAAASRVAPGSSAGRQWPKTMSANGHIQLTIDAA